MLDEEYCRLSGVTLTKDANLQRGSHSGIVPHISNPVHYAYLISKFFGCLAYTEK